MATQAEKETSEYAAALCAIANFSTKGDHLCRRRQPDQGNREKSVNQ